MAQHDMNIANQGFPATRADLNNALQALATNSSGTSAPSTTFANQWWYDTTNNKLYIRNEANNAWIQVAVLDQTNNEWQITTGQITAGDSDGLVFKTDDGNTRITLSDGGDVTFADGTDVITASAGTDNVRIGEGAGDSIASGGNNNVLIGKDAGTAITTADNNTAVGYQAAYTNTTGTENTAIGSSALFDNTTGNYNTAVGGGALANNTTGDYNTAFGRNTLDANTTGYANAAFAADAMGNTTTGFDNTAVGNAAMFQNTTGSYNVGLGRAALQNNTTASNNTAVGYQAGYTNNSNASTFVGYQAGNSANAVSNTFVGASAGSTITSGAYNTIIGRFNGNENGLDIRTSSNNIVLSDGDGNPRAYYSGGFWYMVSDVADNYALFLKNSSGTRPYGLGINMPSGTNNTTEAFLVCQDNSATRMVIYSNGNVVNTNNSYGAYSDQKLKENIVDSGSQWNDVKAIRVRKYSLIADELDAPNKLGVIAQELEASGMNGLVTSEPDIDPDTKEDLGTETKSVQYSVLYMKAVKALQEAMTRIETLETKVAALEAE